MLAQSSADQKATPITWGFGFVAALLALIAFREPLAELVKRWNSQQEYSHGFLIPLVTVWLLWARRDALSASVARPAWSGSALVLLAMLLHAAGQLSAIALLSQLAFVICLLGIVLAVGGFAALRIAFVPVVFLIFAIPPPAFIEANLSLELQLISSRLGVAFIRFFDVPVYLEGNIIDLGTYKLQVVDACSGLRYLYPLFSLSFLAAYLFKAPVWQRALVLFSSVPITIAMNGFRIGIVGVTVSRWGPQMAEGLLHLFEGWIIFAASALFLLTEIYLLARIFHGPRFEMFGFAPETIQSGASGGSGPSDRKPLYACLLVICATISTGSLLANRSEVIPERSRFVTFPATIGDWQGHTSLLEPQTEQNLALEDYLLSDYRNPAGKTINLYVAYYSSQRTGEYHSPLVCIPADGWSIARFERTLYSAGHPLNRAIIERNGSKQLVYYWYAERGRNIASEYWSKWYLLYDAIALNRSDGALVRMITPILPNEVEGDADDRLRQFIRDLGKSLNAFIAASDAQKTITVEQNPARRSW